MLDRKVFLKGFAGLCELFDRKMTKLLAETYYNAVKNLTEEEFNMAIDRLIARSTFSRLPLPGEFLKNVHGEDEDMALRALQTLSETISRVGAYRSISFADKTLQHVINSLGGWVQVCSIPVDEWKWFKRDFLKLYTSCKRMGIKSPDDEVLLGLHDLDSIAKGLPNRQSVVKIGFDGVKLVEKEVKK